MDMSKILPLSTISPISFERLLLVEQTVAWIAIETDTLHDRAIAILTGPTISAFRLRRTVQTVFKCLGSMKNEEELYSLMEWCKLKTPIDIDYILDKLSPSELSVFYKRNLRIFNELILPWIGRNPEVCANLILYLGRTRTKDEVLSPLIDLLNLAECKSVLIFELFKSGIKIDVLKRLAALRSKEDEFTSCRGISLLYPVLIAILLSTDEIEASTLFQDLSQILQKELDDDDPERIRDFGNTIYSVIRNFQESLRRRSDVVTFMLGAIDERLDRTRNFLKGFAAASRP